MKLLVAVLSMVLFSNASDRLLVVDKDLRRPLGHTLDFTTQLYLQRNFPVYESETAAVINAVDKAVKWMGKEESCSATTKIAAGHTSIVVELKCEDGKKINLTLFTEVEESQTSYSFAMVRNEYDVRKVQRKLLDFATYINP